MSHFGIRLADGHTQGEFPVELRVREVHVSAGVHGLHHLFRRVVAVAVPEADQVQRRVDGELELVAVDDPLFERLGQLDMPANVVAEPLGAVVADHEPEFQGPKTTAQWHVPVTVVEHFAGVRGLIAQILGQDAQGVDQCLAIIDEKRIAVEVREHPLVGVESVAISRLDTVIDEAEFRADGRRPGHRRVDVQPEPVFFLRPRPPRRPGRVPAMTSCPRRYK